MNRGVVRSGIPAAAGYPSYSHLTSCVFSDEMLARFYCATVFGEITDTTGFEGLGSYGSTVVFRKRPKAKIRKYFKDMVLKHDTLGTDFASLTIGDAYYFSLKVDEIDRMQIEDWDMWADAFMEDAAIQMRAAVDSEILCSIYTKVDCKNKGSQAGCSSGAYNLGMPGAPVDITPANIGEKLMEMAAVLDEACIPENDRWIVLPPKFKVLLSQSPWGQCCLNESSDALFLNGKLPGDIAGFKVFISNRVSRVFDPAVGLWVWNIVAGWKSASSFIAQIEKNRIAYPAEAFDTMYQGLLVYGHDVIYPEALVHLYATF